MRADEIIKLAQHMAESRVRDNERREDPTLIESIVRINMQFSQVVINKDSWLPTGRVVVLEQEGALLVHPDDVERVTDLVKQVQIQMRATV